jgi:general secretion pathway protein A
MYLDFFGFREMPFSLTPDPRFVFLSNNHKEAFAHLLYGINNRSGFIVLTGEVGSGKTTVLRALLSQLDVDHYRTALIFNPCLSPTELLQNINREFGIPTDTSNSSNPLDTLNLFLLQQNGEGRIVVLAIDEAQDLETSVLEQIRLISNLETDREKLIQIVLSGQPEFMRILNRDEMRQLNQRVTVRYHLQPMDFQNTVHYINHRLEVAGGRAEIIFSKMAFKRIYKYSGGLPRLINAACDRALLAGYTRDTIMISSRIAKAGIKDLKKNTAVPYSKKRRLILVPTIAILAALSVAVIYFSWYDFMDRFNTPKHIEAIEEKAEKDIVLEEQVKKDSIITGEEFLRLMSAELWKVSEPESARRAFNSLANFWNVSPFSESFNLTQFNEMERSLQERNLRLYRFSGNLGLLLRIDYPAVLEMTMPGMPGRRFISLVGMENEKLLIDPPIAGRNFLSFSELENYWSGNGFLFWKDPLDLLMSNISPEAKGNHVKRLQGLLREIETYSGPLTGIYDSDTMLAVKRFQSLKGIAQDGIVGGQTLMLLHRSIDRFEVPRLSGRRK